MQTIWPEFFEDIREFHRWNFEINREFNMNFILAFLKLTDSKEQPIPILRFIRMTKQQCGERDRI